MEPKDQQDADKNKDQQIDYDALSKKLAEGLREEIDVRLNDHHTKLDQKISSLSLGKGDDAGDDDDDMDEELVVSKKDLKNYIDSALSKYDQKVKQTIGESLQSSSQKASLDEQAMRDFPMLNAQSGSYSKEFQAEVQKEMRRRVSGGSNQDDPNLVYDSAAKVFASNFKYQQMKTSYVEEKARQLNNKDGSFDFTTKQKPFSQGISDAQLDLAKKLNMDVNKVKERFKKKK